MASTKEVSPIIVWKVSPIIVHEPPSWLIRSQVSDHKRKQVSTYVVSELAYKRASNAGPYRPAKTCSNFTASSGVSTPMVGSAVISQAIS